MEERIPARARAMLEKEDGRSTASLNQGDIT
jgi:hypothetical protein